MPKTVVALYDDFDIAQDVVEDLIESGFSRENISLMASDITGDYARRYVTDRVDEDVTAGEGASFGAVVGTLIGLGIALIPGVGPILGAGPLAVALTAGIGAAAGAITGGITAALIDMGVPEEDADYYAEGLRRGGTLVSATVDEAWLERVEEIMNRHSPVDIERRAGYWRETGWTGFNPEVTPYTTDEIVRERERYHAHGATSADMESTDDYIAHERNGSGTTDTDAEWAQRSRVYERENR